MYIKCNWVSHDKSFIIVKKYHSMRAMPDNPKIRERRKPRREFSSVSQEEINRRLKAERIQRQLMDNWRAGDWYITLTFSTSTVPKTEDEAKAVLEKFKRSLRALFRRRGKELLYISIIENIRGRGRCHVHMIIPALDAEDRKTLARIWPHGHVNVALYGGEAMDAYRTAQYFVKLDAKETSSHVMTSRNLIQNEPEKEVVSRAQTYLDKMTVPKGYRLVKPLSISGFTHEGYPYQKAVFERIEHIDQKRGGP